MPKTINEYETLLYFLEEALRFYANEENYVNDPLFSAKVILDNGHQARFALKQIEVINKANEDMEEELLKQFPKELENTDIQEEFINIIEEFKKLNL